MIGIVALTGLLALPALAGTRETVSFDSDDVTVRSMIGSVKVRSHSGSGVEIIVEAQGKDAREGAIRLEREDNELRIVFPRDQREFVYPAIGGTTTINTGDGWLSRLLGSGRIKVSKSGSGMELWTDVTVLVPEGGRVAIEHAVGGLHADGVSGRLELSTRSGDVNVTSTRGELAVATGSGDIRLTSVEGREVELATGSGDVECDDCHGDSFEIATGSGGISLEGLDSLSVELASGSGDIKMQRARVDELEIGTGSGDVRVELDRLGGGVSIGTGSGDITFEIPAGTPADVHAETRGGDIDVQVGGAEFTEKEDDEVRYTVGGGGSRIRLGSGNGDIVIRG